MTDKTHRETLAEHKSQTERTAASLHDRISEQPLEIITEIFKSISRNGVVLPHRRHDYPWILGHVCSHWRKILWASPSIWTDITIERRHVHGGPYQRVRTYIDLGSAIRESLMYIISNTTAPLSLTVKDGNTDHRLDIITSNASRFRSLSFDYASPEAFVSLLNLPPHSLGTLETFSIMTHTRDVSLMPSTSSLETAPNLRCVNYRIMHSDYIPQCLLLPLEKMTDIRVHRMLVPLNTVQRILRSTPCLVHCAFFISAENTTLSGYHNTQTSLKTLHLETTEALDWSAFLTSFTTPALEDISISSPRLPLNTVTSLIIRSNCSVKRLSLVLLDHHVDAADPSGVESLINQVPPSIISLNMSWVASGLIFWKIQHGLFPKLETIRLNVDADGLGAFIDLANSYTQGVAAGRRCLSIVEICCWVEPEVIEHYTRWAKSYKKIEGLDILVFDAATGMDMMDSSNVDESESEDGESESE